MKGYTSRRAYLESQSATLQEKLEGGIISKEAYDRAMADREAMQGRTGRLKARLGRNSGR